MATDSGGRYGGPPFLDPSIYDRDGVCYRCGGAAMVSEHYGPWCMAHNVERIERIDRRFEEIAAALHTAAHPPAGECSADECLECGERDCPEGEPLHYHHDGCPACDGPSGHEGEG